MCFHILWETCGMNELPDTDTPPYVTCMSLSKTIGDWWIPDVISTMLPKHWCANCKSNRHKRHITQLHTWFCLIRYYALLFNVFFDETEWIGTCIPKPSGSMSCGNDDFFIPQTWPFSRFARCSTSVACGSHHLWAKFWELLTWDEKPHVTILKTTRKTRPDLTEAIKHCIHIYLCWPAKFYWRWHWFYEKKTVSGHVSISILTRPGSSADGCLWVTGTITWSSSLDIVSGYLLSTSPVQITLAAWSVGC